MENNIEKLKQLNVDTDAQKAFKPQFLQAVKRFGKVALVSSMLALNMACQQPTGPEPIPAPGIEQPENPGNTPENPGNNPEYPENTPTNPGNNPTNPGNTPENPGNNPENPGNTPENPGNNPTNPENPNGGNEEQTDQAVQNVISLIDALPNANDITAENKATVQTQIDAIEAAYAELTAEQKQQVTNYSKVTAAKNKITEIENGLNQQQNQFPEPTTATLGDYTMYDFVQNNTIQFSSPLEEMELFYLQKAEGYIQNNLNALSDSAKQNTTISNAINYYNQNAKKHYQGTYIDIGAAHNKTTKAIAPVFQEIVKQLDEKSGENTGFEFCYRVLANEVYRNGLGDCKDQNRPETTKYNSEKEYLSDETAVEFFDYIGIDIKNVYQTKNFTTIVNKYNEYLTKAANKIDGVTVTDLKNITSIAFNTKSMQSLANLEMNAGLNATKLNENTIVGIINNPYQTLNYNQSQGREY
ncbi:MAG: hypothetical protein KIG16_01355 [Eubacteriales bacterium]|nr:hypothetical protein [Eubacteriales bacterium]